MSLVKEQDIFLQHVSQLINKAGELGLTISAGELFRSPEQQEIYINTGRSRTLNSQHLKRLAIDLNFFVCDSTNKLKLTYEHEAIRQLGAFWESLDKANRWGGNWNSFKDTPHFERREGISPTGVNKVFNTGENTKGIDLLCGTVGYKFDNQKDDVELVQRLLNMNASNFKLEKKLVCDGIYGKHTRNAIVAFQESTFGENTSDGQISPNDKTVTALCQVLPESVDETFLQFLYLAADSKQITEFLDPIVHCMDHYQINTSLRQAHFLAQIGHESGELRFQEEIASGHAYEGRVNLGNTQPGDGARFKGRGLIQLTGRANYKEYANANQFGKDVLSEPHLIAEDKALCVDVAGWFWHKHELNVLADKDDLERLTRRINGGINGLAHRRKLYLRAKSLFGIA